MRAAWNGSTNIFECKSAKIFVDELPLATWLARSSPMRSPATTPWLRLDLADAHATSPLKKLPRYPDVPVARLGRLAVGQKFQGRKLGAALLWDAIERAVRSEVVVCGVVVDAKDDGAVAFYEHHGFITLSAETRQLVLPLTNLREGLAKR